MLVYLLIFMIVYQRSNRIKFILEEKMKYVKNIWTGIVCLLGSYYLTWCVDKTTLETLPQRLFIYIYFLIMLGLIFVLQNRYLRPFEKILPGKVVTTILSIIVSTIILIVGFDFLIGRYQPTHISVTAMGQTGQTHEKQNGTEVWISSIILDGKQFELSKIPLAQDWEYRDNNLLSYQNQPSTLEFELPKAEKIEIYFLSHPWSGEVLVRSNQESQKLDLYRTEEQGSDNVTLSLSGERRIFLVWDWMAIIGCFILLLPTINTVGCFLMWRKSIKTEDNFTSSTGIPDNYKLLYMLAVFTGTNFLISRYAIMEPYSKIYFALLCGVFSVLLILTSVAYFDALKEHNVQRYNIRIFIAAIILSAFVVLLLVNNLYSAEFKSTFMAVFYLRSLVLFSLCTLTLYLSFGIMSSRLIGVIVPAFLFSIVLPLSGWLESWTTGALFLTTLFLFCILFFAIYVLREKFDFKYSKIEKVVGRVNLIFFVCITFFSVFLWSYNKIVLSPNEIQGGISIIGFLGISTVYASAFGINMLTFLQLIRNKISKKWITTRAIEIQKNELKVFPVLMIFMISYWLIWLIAYFPATMSNDNVDQWGQTIGVYPFVDNHPILHTLFIWSCSLIWKSPAMGILVQITLTAVVLACIFDHFTLYGFNKKVLIALGCAVAMLPNVSIYVVSLWKDVLFLIALIVLGYLMQKIFINKKLGVLENFALGIAISGISLLRHNGFLIALICGFIILLTIFKRRLTYSAVSVLLSLIFVFIFNGPVYKALGVEHYGIGLAGTVTDCVGYTIYYEGKLPKDILEEATKDATIDFWKDKFTPFNAFNYIYNGEYNLSRIYANKSSFEQISIILRLFWNNPNIIFYERMVMNDANLFINQSESPYSYNYRYENGIYKNEFGLAHKDTKLKTFLDKLLATTSWKNQFLDSFLWRNGVMICIALWVIYFNFIRKKWTRNIVFIPMIINFATLFIGLAEQSYRFTHNIVPYLIMAILFAVMPDEADEQTNMIFARKYKEKRIEF